MKKIFFSLVLFCSCSSSDSALRNIHFDKLDFTFDNGWKESYSLSINKTGSMLVGIGRWNKKYYVTKISESELISLDSLVMNLPFEKYDTVYRTNIVDQASYKIVIPNTQSANKNQSIFVYGNNAPVLIDQLCNKIKIIKENAVLESIDTTVSFLSERNFYPLGAGM